MMTRALLFSLAFMLLAACGGDRDAAVFPDRRPADLIYSYPYDGQMEVSPRSPLVLHFSDALTLADEAAALDALRLEASADPGNELALSARFVSDKRGLVLTPQQSLQPATEYRLFLDGLSTARGTVTVDGGVLAFRTRGALQGPRSERVLSDVFQAERLIPDGDQLPVMDFSSLRVTLTQPVAAASVSYGLEASDTVALTDSSGRLVEALVLARSRYLTIDPVDELMPGESYTLTLTGGLQSVYGDAFSNTSFNIQPGDSTPRETIVQRVPDSDGGRILSPLTGEPINSVPVQATLLGDDSSSQQTGDAYAELAFVPNYPVISPLRIKRGQILAGSNVELLVAGAVPAGVNSGTLSVTFLSDAMGFLMPNQYSSRDDSPRHVRLYMDVAMTAEDNRANGGLSQDIMHVEVAGTAIVEDGKLKIDAVGVVEPNLLGVEDAFGLLSFSMEAYADQLAAPEQVLDLDPPTLHSWVPGAVATGNVPRQSQDDPVILNFNEPLDPISLRMPGALMLLRDGVPVAADQFDYRLDGASVVINLSGGIAYNTDYQIVLSSMITDLAGNGLASGDQLPADYTLALRLPHFVDDGLRSPIALSVYPGFPCHTVNRDLDNGDHGQCAGGLASDDHLPVTTLPENRAIRVNFSGQIDRDSVQLGGSFRVEQDNGSGWQAVDGELDIGPRSVRFMPDQPWVNDGSVVYRYVLGSRGPDGDTAVDCSGSLSICDINGYPLQTRVLAQDPDDVPGPTEGGPDMDIYFLGAPAVQTVYQPALNLPALDVNSNNIHDGRTADDYDNDGATLAEQYPLCAASPAACEDLPESDGLGGYLTPPNASQLLVDSVDPGNSVIRDANVGCAFDGSSRRQCPERKFINLTGALNAEMIGAVTYDGPDSPVGGEPAVLVGIYPTLLTTTSLDVYARTDSDVIYTPTGPQVLRARYACNDDAAPACEDGADTSDLNDRGKLIPGYMLDRCEDREVMGDTVTGSRGCPVFRITFDLYLDAPSLNPTLFGVPLEHSVHSLPRSVTLEGPVNTLADGRLEIAQQNGTGIDLELQVNGTVPLGPLSIPTGISETINVVIPSGGVFLNYITAPAKE